MATTKEYHDYVCDCLSRVGGVSTKKMMGEYCVYYNEKLIGDICDNRFLVKQTDTSKKLLADCKMEYPYEGSRSLMFVVEEMEDAELMQELLQGMYEELPEPKKKTSKTGLSALTNIGPAVAGQLVQVGIHDAAELKKIGAREAWLRIQAIDESACIHRLLALEGAIQNVKKAELSEEVKADLKQFYKEHKI